MSTRIIKSGKASKKQKGKKGVFSRLWATSSSPFEDELVSSDDEKDSLDEWLNEEGTTDVPGVLCMYENEKKTGKGRVKLRNPILDANDYLEQSEWAWIRKQTGGKLRDVIPPALEKRKPPPPQHTLVSDYTPARIREKGPQWFVKNMYKHLEVESTSLDHVGNIATLMIKSFPIVIFNKRASSSGKSVTRTIRQIMANLDISDSALLDIVIDTVNSRAAKKVYRDLRDITQLQKLPVLFVNETLIGGEEAVNRSIKVEQLQKLPVLFVNETLIGGEEAVNRSIKVGALLPHIRAAVTLDVRRCPDCGS